MVTKSTLKVSVVHTETEIIESTRTVTSEERRFGVGNGDKEIIVTAWGSDDNQNWEEIESKTVEPHTYVILIAGPSHWWNLKLTGRATASTETSIVDGYLEYTEPD
jgi:hypothetical protein